MRIPLKPHVAALALALCLATGTVAAEVAAIVSAKRAAMPPVTQAQLADIFLGRSSRFADGTPAVPCDLPEGSATRDEFYTKVVGKSAAQMKAHWSKIIFTGRGQPPREVANSQEAKKLVAENPHVVCYIEGPAVDKSVNVLLTR